MDCAVQEKRYLLSEAEPRHKCGIPQCCLPALTYVSGNAYLFYYYMGIEKFAVVMKISAFWPLL